MAHASRPSLPVPSLRDGFLGSAARFPDRPALEIGDGVWTYEDLLRRATAMAATLERHAPRDEPRLTGVFAQDSPTAYAGVLAALFRGHGYLPLSRGFPARRTRTVLDRSRCRSIIADAESIPALESVLPEVDAALLVLVPEGDVDALRERWPRHSFLGLDDLLPYDPEWPLPPTAEDDLAYLLFTSGSTGEPKGVMVAHRNVRAFLRAVVDRYGIDERDRVAQTSILPFDLSVFPIFAAWERGACLCCPRARELIKPDLFIERSRLSVWVSVPSTAVLMKRMHLLKPGRFRTLRLSFFCGEALPMEVAKAWQAATPEAVLENTYGPTEATVACTGYCWDDERSPDECVGGVVPIGEPFEGVDVMVADADLRPVPPGEEGELLVSGPQVTLGYFGDEARTAASFVVPPGRREIYYRTGDRVARPDPAGPLVYLGRMDNQIKIRGYRVELGDVEAALRVATGLDAVVALGWPVKDGAVTGLVAFLGGGRTIDVPAVKASMRSRVPDYMVPSAYHCLESLPLNSNGKVDRTALRRTLEEAR